MNYFELAKTILKPLRKCVLCGAEILSNDFRQQVCDMCDPDFNESLKITLKDSKS